MTFWTETEATGLYSRAYCAYPRDAGWAATITGSYCEYPRRSACPIIRISEPMAATLPLGRVMEGRE